MKLHYGSNSWMTILQDRAARPNLEMCRPMKPQTLVPVRAHGCSATVGEGAIGQRGEPAARDLAPSARDLVELFWPGSAGPFVAVYRRSANARACSAKDAIHDSKAHIAARITAATHCLCVILQEAPPSKPDRRTMRTQCMVTRRRNQRPGPSVRGLNLPQLEVGDSDSPAAS